MSDRMTKDRLDQLIAGCASETRWPTSRELTECFDEIRACWKERDKNNAEVERLQAELGRLRAVGLTHTSYEQALSRGLAAANAEIQRLRKLALRHAKANNSNYTAAPLPQDELAEIGPIEEDKPVDSPSSPEDNGYRNSRPRCRKGE